MFFVALFFAKFEFINVGRCKSHHQFSTSTIQTSTMPRCAYTLTSGSGKKCKQNTTGCSKYCHTHHCKVNELQDIVDDNIQDIQDNQDFVLHNTIPNLVDPYDGLDKMDEDIESHDNSPQVPVVSRTTGMTGMTGMTVHSEAEMQVIALNQQLAQMSIENQILKDKYKTLDIAVITLVDVVARLEGNLDSNKTKSNHQPKAKRTYFTLPQAESRARMIFYQNMKNDDIVRQYVKEKFDAFIGPELAAQGKLKPPFQLTRMVTNTRFNMLSPNDKGLWIQKAIDYFTSMGLVSSASELVQNDINKTS